MPYEMLDHTADVMFRATSDSLEGAFSEVVRAFSEIVTYDESPELDQDKIETSKIEVESENLDALLYDFLDRLIYTQDVKGVFITEAKKIELEETDESYRLNAELEVYPIEELALLDIKGPTYNDMKVEEDGDGWLIEAVLDI